jgi:hypothetical protein
MNACFLEKASLGMVGILLVMAGCAGDMKKTVREPPSAVKRELSSEERQLIEVLLERLKGRTDLKFVRDGVVYDAGMAAWYMRLKWSQNREKVKSVEDFIALESVGGEKGEITYYVEFSDGRRRTAREVLEESVKKLKGEKPGASSQ